MNDRILRIIREKNLTITRFSKIVGMNQSNLSMQFRGERKLSLETVVSLLDSFEDVSAEFIMRGKGDMFIGSGAPANTDHEIDILKKYLKFSKETIDKLRETIAGLEDEIIKLRSEIEVLKEDNNRSSGIG